MSLGSFLMVLGSILAFGFMCFIGGIEFKAGNKGNAMYMAVIGIILLNTAFDIIRPRCCRGRRQAYSQGVASELLDFFDNALFQSL